MKNNNKQGYILILTLMILSLCVVLVTYIFNKGAVAAPYCYAMVKREQAKQLALSGIQVAISQLSKPIEVKQKAKQPAAPPAPAAQGQPAKPAELSAQEQATNQYIERLVPSINRWQIFNLVENKDGIDGQIKISISSEDGKININEWYDFDKHEFKAFTLSSTPPPTQPGQPQSAQQAKPGEKKEETVKLVLVSVLKDAGKDLMSEFEKFLKERQYRLDDVTELLQIKGFEAYKHRLFYEPPVKKEGQQGERPMYLSDIFTVWSGKMTLDPWLLSDSVSGMLGLNRAEPGDIERRKKIVAQGVKDFNPNADIKENWKKVFAPLNGKDLQDMPKGIEFIMNMKFAPSLFSVLSYGKVGDVTQKLLAILESKQEFKEDTLLFTVTIKKVIWL